MSARLPTGGGLLAGTTFTFDESCDKVINEVADLTQIFHRTHPSTRCKITIEAPEDQHVHIYYYDYSADKSKVWSSDSLSVKLYDGSEVDESKLLHR